MWPCRVRPEESELASHRNSSNSAASAEWSLSSTYFEVTWLGGELFSWGNKWQKEAQDLQGYKCRAGAHQRRLPEAACSGGVDDDLYLSGARRFLLSLPRTDATRAFTLPATVCSVSTYRKLQPRWKNPIQNEQHICTDRFSAAS